MVGLLYAIFDKVIWASNAIAPSPLLSPLLISLKTRTTNFRVSWGTAWPTSPRIRSSRSITLSCRRACQWKVIRSESNTQIVEGKGPTFDNASSENELPVRWSETSEGTSVFLLVRVASLIVEFVSVLEQAGGEKKTGVNRVSGIYQTKRTASDGFAESILICGNKWVETAGQTYEFLERHWRCLQPKICWRVKSIDCRLFGQIEQWILTFLQRWQGGPMKRRNKNVI